MRTDAVVAGHRLLVRRFWVPLLLLSVLLGTTVGALHGAPAAVLAAIGGASVGEDPHLLTGPPRHIPAEEWGINTPLRILQKRTGVLSRTQPLLGAGADLALSYDLPIADRWAVFRPQHWGFLVLPLDQGFAFHWWFPGLLAFALWLLVVTRLKDGR